MYARPEAIRGGSDWKRSLGILRAVPLWMAPLRAWARKESKDFCVFWIGTAQGLALV